jgi:para-aminobenzoate synthetase component 1
VSGPSICEFPYPEDSAALFSRIAHLPWSVLLDSGPSQCGKDRYDILTAAPRRTLVTRGTLTRVSGRGGGRVSRRDPFSLLHEELRSREAVASHLPFSGGAIGFFAYDLGRRIEQLPSLAVDDLGMPEMVLGIYDWALVVDRQASRAWLAGEVEPNIHALLATADRHRPRSFRVRSDLIANMGREAYARAFARIQHYIREGDCYQVNLARRFSVLGDGDPWALYWQLRQLNPAPFGAYLSTPYAAVLSVSPERFLRVRNAWVETCPIKGTRRRGASPEEDQRLAAELRSSTKDRAENLMIVDLLRNDLGKTCIPGSIRVPHLFAVEPCPTVHHLVSTVTGRLAHGAHALDLLRGCFPGGSITGAPKLRSMEIIDELEPHRRSVYCGAIGYVGYDGAMDSNIAIRTLIYRNASLHFWAGSGIVADSELEAEYQEILDKGQAVWKLLQQPEVAHVGGQAGR